MTPRSYAWTRRAALASLGSLGLFALSGCDPRQALYFLQPFEPTVKAPGPSLKGKRVVILTKLVPGASNDFAALDRDLARELSSILKSKVKKLDLVDVDKVLAWDRAHPNWSDPAEAGHAFEADMVLFFEIARFQVQSPSSPELFEGRANVHVRVIELKHPEDDRGRPMTEKAREAKIAYDNDRETTFPARGPMPASAGVNAATFKNKFLKLVTTELSWDFVEHATGDGIQETRFTE